MRPIVFAMLAFLAVSAMTISCSKSNTKSDPNSNGNGSDSVAGYWFGSFDQGSYNQGILLRANGTVKVYDFYFNPTSKDTTNAYDGYGTWSYNNGKISIVDSFDNGQKFTSVNNVNFKVTPYTFTNDVTGDKYTKQ